MPRLPDPVREQFWRQHLAHQAASGLSVRAYCRRHQLTETSFYAWRRSFQAAQTRGDSSASPAFLPVAVIDAVPERHDSRIDIRLADGTRLRVRAGCDQQFLADVLDVLQRLPRQEDR